MSITFPGISTCTIIVSTFVIASKAINNSCLFNCVALAQPFGLLHFIVITLYRPLPPFLFLFCFCLLVETFCLGWPQICSKPPCLSLLRITAMSYQSLFGVFLSETCFGLLLFVCLFFSLWAMNFYYYPQVLQIKEPNRSVWKLNLGLCLSLYLHTGATLSPHWGQQISGAPLQTALGTLGAAAFLQDGTWSLQLQELEQEQELPVVCAVAAGSICSTSQGPKESAKIGHAFGRHAMKLCIGMVFSEGGSSSGRQRISWSQNMFTLLSCYLLEPLAGFPLDCSSP